MNHLDRNELPDYNFNMGAYFDKAWNLFKKGAGSYIGFTLLFFVIIIVMNVIPFINLLSFFVQTPLLAGFFVFSAKLIKNKEEFGNFFEGFEYFGQIILHQIVMILFMIPIYILTFTMVFPLDLFMELAAGNTYAAEDFFSDFDSKAPFFFGALFLIFVLSIGLQLLYSLTIPFIVNNKMQFWEAMETSRKLVSKKFLSFFAMFLIIGVIMAIGITITCGLGLLVVVPFYFCTIYTITNSILPGGVNSVASSIDDFGSTDRDINTEREEF